jgi:hypothetical protein
MWKSMKTWALVVSSVAVLAACGGSDDPNPYGAIAVDESRPAAVIVTNFISQKQADDSAISRCGSAGCAVVWQFSGKGSCAALASGGGSGFVWGAANGGTQAEAEANAVSACSAKGGVNCQIPASIPGKCM